MSEVGALIIKLQAETAQFREDMGKVKSDLNGLKDGAGSTGDAFDGSMRESTGAVRLLSHELGVPLPRELSRLIATIPTVGSLFSTMLPIIGVVAAIAVIGELIKKHEALKAAMAKLGDDQTKVSTTFVNAMNGWQSKIDEARARIDDLNGNHMAALQFRLKEIDRQTLKELVSQFDSLDTAAGKVFETLKAGMFEFGHGSEGAKDALEHFQTQYSNLIALGKVPEANSLLAGTLADAKKYLAIQEELRSHPDVYNEDLVAYARLHNASVDASDKAYQSQQELVSVLQEKISLTQKATEAVKAEKKEATDKAIKDTIKDATERQKELNDSINKGMENYVTFGRVQRESFKGANTTEIGQVEAFFKAEAEAQKKASQEEFQAAQQNFADEAEVVKASLDQQRSAIENASNLGVITRQQAIREEMALIQRETGVRLASLAQEVAAKRRAVQQEIDADNLAASHVLAANNGNKADPNYIAFLNDAGVKMAQLDAITNKYNADLKSLVTTQQTQMASLGQNMLKSFTPAIDGFSQGIAKSIVEGKRLGVEMRQVAREIAESWIETTIKRMIMDRLVTVSHITGNAQQAASDKASAAQSQLAAAKAAAAKAYQAMAGIPIVGPELGAVAAAAVFAGAMAFEKGGKIPGAGAVPIIGHGGETVVTKALTDRVERAEGKGGNTYGPTQVHAHFSPTIHAIDAEGVEGMLKKHQAVFQREITRSLRKLNR